MGYLDYLLEAQLACRGHAEAALYALDGGFALPGDKAHYPPDRVVDIKHVRLDITLDLDAKRVRGTVAHTFSPLNDGVSSIDLDAVELEIIHVRLASGLPLTHSRSDGKLHIDLDAPR